MSNDTPTPCERCGHPHARCSAHRKTDPPTPCTQRPMRGQSVCRMHGGKQPAAIANAERRLADRAAVLAAETFGLPVEVDPHTALLDELHRTVGAVQWLGAVVADLDREAVAWGKTEETDKQSGEFPGTDTTRAAKPNAFVALWQAERAHLVKVSAACISAGIEERRVRLAEQQGQLLAGAMRAVVDGLFGALVEALGSHEAALGVVRESWPVWVGSIVPSALRSLELDR